LVVPGLFYAFRFSPDDRRLAGVTLVSGSIQLVIIEVATGQMTFPLAVSPGRLVHRPSWSPDGQRIAYARGWSFSEPPDSGGIHILDLRTGQDRPIGGAGTILNGGEPRWLPTDQIAFVELDAGRLRLMVVDPDGQNVRTLHRSRREQTYRSLHWYERHTMGQRGVLFTDNDLPPYGGLFLARPDGGAVVRMPDFWAPVSSTDAVAFSPDGEEIVHHGVDPVDSLDVLFVSRVGDQASASTRQLTRYSPPPPAQTSSPPDPAFVRNPFQSP
jgi:dipeptidyl aminopeptidase/acylaminoacyl peptidase